VHNTGELSNRLIEDLGKHINRIISFSLMISFSMLIDKIKDGIK